MIRATILSHSCCEDTQTGPRKEEERRNGRKVGGSREDEKGENKQAPSTPILLTFSSLLVYYHRIVMGVGNGYPELEPCDHTIPELLTQN